MAYSSRSRAPSHQSKLFFMLFMVLATVSGSSEGAQKGILVAAAASLKDAFGQIGGMYQKQSGVRVTFTFGASGALEKQIEAGAPVDVFASAGEREMRDLQEKRLIESGSQADFAGNSLVLVVPAGEKSPIHSFSDLRRPGVKMIAIGNPKTVPAGQYAEEFLQKARLWSAIQPRLIFAEDVRQVLDYVDHGDVDAGIVYATDVAISHGKALIVARAPDGQYGPIRYPIAVIKTSRQAQAALNFIRFVRSPAGRTVLKSYGFAPAP